MIENGQDRADREAPPQAPTEDQCPHRHPRSSPEPDCVLCQVAARNPLYYDRWAGRKVNGRPGQPPPPGALMSRNVSPKKVCQWQCPGTELKLLLASMGIESGNCNCNSRAAQMDGWGVDGCRQRESEIIEWLKAEAKRAGWGRKVLLAVANLRTGIRLRLNPLDPCPGLVREAIRRAETASGGLTADGRAKPPWEEESAGEGLPDARTGIPADAQESSVVESAPPQGELMAKTVTWAYGVTTVPKRREGLLLRTLVSLKTAGFDRPRLFVDGADCRVGLSYEDEFGLDVTAHGPTPLLTHGNWWLALHELFVRDPHADRFAIFQDDLVAVRGLRTYLSLATYPRRAYLNLLTFPLNQKAAPSQDVPGFFPAQTAWRGLGALALVFDREAVQALLHSEHMALRPLTPDRGATAVDGGIAEAMQKAGFREYCHNPSLVQHTGDESTICHGKYPQAPSFPGEDYNAAELLKTTRL